MTKTPSVLITGTSSGIGRAAAHEMKARGWRVFASARKEEDLAELDQLGFETVYMDMADTRSIEEAVQQVLKSSRAPLDGLVNNAGFGQPGALEDLTVDQMRRQFDVNVIGLQHLTNLILPGMIGKKAGRVVHVSSVVGRVALPFLGIYSASKFAVEALADAQRVELSGTGVSISLVEPGPIDTKFGDNAVRSGSDGGLTTGPSRFQDLYKAELSRRDGEAKKKPFALPPEAVAEKIAHALCADRPRRRYKVTVPAYAGALLSRLAPDAVLDGILSRELSKRQRQSSS